MWTSDGPGPADGSDFSAWLRATHDLHGDFTALLVLVEIGGTKVTPIASTFLNIIGSEIGWADMLGLLAGAGRRWDGACFFPQLEAGRPLDNAAARARLRSLEQRLAEDRLVLNDGAFFDRLGRRMEVSEVPSLAN